MQHKVKLGSDKISTRLDFIQESCLSITLQESASTRYQVPIFGMYGHQTSRNGQTYVQGRMMTVETSRVLPLLLLVAA